MIAVGSKAGPGDKTREQAQVARTVYHLDGYFL